LRGGGIAASVVALAVLGIGSATAHAAGTPALGADGTTAPVYSYQDAIRERVFVPVAGVDQDGNGVTDRVAVDIVRPKESGASLKVPAIIDDSPYYTSLGRGNETQYIHTGANGSLDLFPLFYDNYFVPRGYAYIAAHAVGTAFSTGCPLHGGPGDVAGFKAVIDWLEGRVQAFTTADGTAPVAAGWANGKNAMIGKSYDGTFANGVAATGVDGLTTIVPISAISSWYDYSRMGGIRENTSPHYPASLDNAITNLPGGMTAAQQLATLGVLPPDHKQPCANVFANLNTIDGDDTGDMNPFWIERDYTKDVGKVKAAVFASHGLTDDNVRTKQFAQWWAGLAANGVPRKLWLHQAGHVDPFDYRRAAWVDTLHKWFDHWLYGVQNGIMDQPRVDIERTPDTWETAADWPLPGTTTQRVYLQNDAVTGAGGMGLKPGGLQSSVQFTDQTKPDTRGRLASPPESAQISNLTADQAGRLVWLSRPLTHDLHLSGTPYVDLFASLDKPQSNIGAMLVDYGAGASFSKISRSNDGVRNDTVRDCVGDSTAADGACYLRVVKSVQDVKQFRIAKGMLDSSNRDSLYSASDVAPGQEYEFKFDVLPTDYVIPAGHQVGLVVEGNYTDFSSVANTAGATITVDAKKSNLQLPVVGGADALAASGGFVASTQVTEPVGGSVPATLALTLGGPASFGAFTPGLDRDYTAQTSATVVSSAGDATLTVSDPGHLTNGAFALPSPLQVSFAPAAWTGPVSDATVPISFAQHIGAEDALRTGAYGNTLTFTLSTTSP
jgi:X-Pro dipeptidyl-peptidase